MKIFRKNEFILKCRYCQILLKFLSIDGVPDTGNPVLYLNTDSSNIYSNFSGGLVSGLIQLNNLKNLSLSLV